MSETISGVANQIFQQILDKQNLNQQTNQTGNKRTFESYLQQDNPQTQEKTKPAPTESTQTVREPTTSGTEMQRKLDDLQRELTETMRQSNQQQFDFKKMIPELTESKTRFGLLKDAYDKIGDTSKVTSGLSGQLIDTEREFKEVEAIMRSDKKLSTGELLALQARLYQVSQHIEVMSKVVDQMAGGIKTVLNTNV